MDLGELFIWRSEWFLQPAVVHRQFLFNELDSMRARTWCLKKRWDVTVPNLKQLPGDTEFAVGMEIPYENLDKMIRMALHAMFKAWDQGYPWPDTYENGIRKIPMIPFFISGEWSRSTQKSKFCHFLAKALKARDMEKAIADKISYGEHYTQLDNLLDIHRLEFLNTELWGRLTKEWIEEVVQWYKEQGHTLPRDGWDFNPFQQWLKHYYNINTELNAPRFFRTGYDKTTGDIYGDVVFNDGTTYAAVSPDSGGIFYFMEDGKTWTNVPKIPK